MRLAKIRIKATNVSLGTVSVGQGMRTVLYRYRNVSELNLEEGMWVLGETYGSEFSVIELAPLPCNVLQVDFLNKRYMLYRSDGQISGWHRTKKEMV